MVSEQPKSKAARTALLIVLSGIAIFAAILVPPGRVGPLAAALEKLITDEHSRRTLARRSLRRARHLPTWAASEVRFILAVNPPTLGV